jgi:hypothetical protein
VKQVIIGYFNDKNNTYPEFPFPEIETNPGSEYRQTVMELTKFLSDKPRRAYKGWSTCRICGEHNGSEEYQFLHRKVQYIIPVGYLHYLKEHQIKIDPNVFMLLGKPR